MCLHHLDVAPTGHREPKRDDAARARERDPGLRLGTGNTSAEKMQHRVVGEVRDPGAVIVESPAGLVFDANSRKWNARARDAKPPVDDLKVGEIDAVLGELDQVHPDAPAVPFAAKDELAGVHFRDVRHLVRWRLVNLPAARMEKEDLSMHLPHGDRVG